MKRLVLVVEGEGDCTALPVLAKKLLKEKDQDQRLVIDDGVIRAGDVSGLVRWDKEKAQPDYREWRRFVRIAGSRKNLGGVLAVFDGDGKHFPAGSPTPFCAATAAKTLATAAADAGAGKMFSLAVVFACVEYETWIIAGTESLAGKSFKDGRPALPASAKFPAGEPESHAKRWLLENLPGYRETRDQSALTELLDLNVVRSKHLRSFARLEHAIDELLEASGRGRFIATPG